MSAPQQTPPKPIERLMRQQVGTRSIKTDTFMDRIAGPQTGHAPRRIGLVHSPTNLVEMPINRAMTISTWAHILSPIVATALVFLLALLLSWLLHFNLWDWLTPKPKKDDITFTLVPDTHAKKPKDPKMKGAFNQQAGGERVKDQPLAPPEQPAQASPPVQQPPQQPTQPRQVANAQPVSKPQPQQKPTPQKQPAPPKTKPVAKLPDLPKPTFKPSIPMPKAPAPKASAKKAPDGPIAKTSPTQASRPSPSAMPTGTLASASPSAHSSASSAASGNIGNAQGGHGNPGIDVEADVDFGPFMADLERRIKRNWHPPRAGISKRVKVQFYLMRDGRLAKVDIIRSSGDATSDKAAIAAVQASAPFRAFPPQVKENMLPIEFTFDYNVYSPGSR